MENQTGNGMKTQTNVTTVTTAKTNDLAIAVIYPLRGNDVGFDWGTDREHVIYTYEERKTPEQIEGYAEKIRRRSPRADVAVVSMSCGGITDDWPSAGEAAWGNDIFLSVADRLSYLEFSALLEGETGVKVHDDYDLDDVTIADTISCSGADNVASAIEELPDGDAVKVKIERVLAAMALPD